MKSGYMMDFDVCIGEVESGISFNRNLLGTCFLWQSSVIGNTAVAETGILGSNPNSVN